MQYSKTLRNIKCHAFLSEWNRNIMKVRAYLLCFFILLYTSNCISPSPSNNTFSFFRSVNTIQPSVIEEHIKSYYHCRILCWCYKHNVGRVEFTCHLHIFLSELNNRFYFLFYIRTTGTDTHNFTLQHRRGVIRIMHYSTYQPRFYLKLLKRPLCGRINSLAWLQCT